MQLPKQSQLGYSSCFLRCCYLRVKSKKTNKNSDFDVERKSEPWGVQWTFTCICTYAGIKLVPKFQSHHHMLCLCAGTGTLLINFSFANWLAFRPCRWEEARGRPGVWRRKKGHISCLLPAPSQQLFIISAAIVCSNSNSWLQSVVLTTILDLVSLCSI